ncbi:hypothetical protein D3C81_62870 [compost metagenome]
MPRWARLTSPGFGTLPPPINPAPDMVWCGERKGLSRIKPCRASISLPAALKIFVTSSASLSDKAGRIPGSRLIIMVLPVPGGPISNILCIPAAAIVSARFT